MPRPRILKRAVELAKQAHSAQTRQDGITPYWHHLERTSLELVQAGVWDEEILASMWLHDSYEDTYLAYSDIRSMFGEKVADWVAWVSDDQRKSAKNQQEDKDYRLLNMPYECTLIKIADMIDNLNDMGVWNQKRQEHFASVCEHSLSLISENPNKQETPEYLKLYRKLITILKRVKDGSV